MILVPICLLLLNFFTPVEDCSITEIRGNVLGCVLKDEEISIDVIQNISVATDTTCIVENRVGVSHVRCNGKDWKIKDTVRNEKLIRRKRGWWRSMWRGVAKVVTGIFHAATCVITLLSCLWAGRAGPIDNTRPSMTCEEPYKHVIAEPYQIYAKVSWREPVANDDTDGKIIPRRRNGRPPGHHFPEGRTLITYEAKDRAGNRNTCTVTVDVTVVRCEQPKSLQNGYYQCHPVTDFLYGGGCRFGCYEGFDLHGTSNIECQKTGKWSNAQPECKPWKCQALPQVQGAGHPTCNKEFYFRSICTYNCNPGFDMPPKVSKALVCDKTKNWRKYGNPKCVDVEPPVFNISTCPSMIIKGTENAANSTIVSWKLPEVNDNSNHTYIHERKDLRGKRLTTGIYTVEYSAKDAAGNSAINDCSFKVVVREIRCPKLYPTPYLRITCPIGYRTGARCDVSCDPGKVLVGSDEINCERNNTGLFGNWNWKDHQQTICKNGKNCVELPPPKNGAVACDNWEGGQFCQVQCRNGTMPVNLKELYVCQSSGDWSKRPPNVRTCRTTRHSHVQHTIGITASYFFDGDCTDPSTQQQIANNFINVLKNSPFGEVCPDSTDCNTGNVQITCGESSRKRRETNSSFSSSVIKITSQLPIPLHGSESFALLQNKTQSVIASVTQILKENMNYIFGDRNVSQIHLSNTGLEIHCPEGSVKSEESWNCIDCPEGTHYVNTGNAAVCEACRKGTYQDKTAQVRCTRCPVGKTTQTVGAMSITECEDACMPGSYSPDGLFPCSPCERGYYQPSFGKMKCQSCRESKSTQTFGAVSASECEEFDIELVPEEQTEIKVTLPETATVKDFTFAFWLQYSPSNYSRNIPFPTIKFLNNQNNVMWTWKNLKHVIRQNNLTTDVDFGLPDSRWHYVTFYNSPTCSVAVTVDGMPMSTESYSGSCDDMSLRMVSFIAEKYTRGSFSQIHLWKGKHMFGYRHRCFPKEVGDILSWKNFEEAELSGAYLHFPSLCDDFNNCVSSPCLHGTCSDALHDFTCTCDNGFLGRHCDINVNDCEFHICMNNATCVDGIANYSCSCPANYTGHYCETEMVDGSWSEWGNWSECSTTCGEGKMPRKRLCNSPSPDNGGEYCVGGQLEYKDCNNTECPVCPSVSAPNNGSIDCSNDTESINCTISCDDGFDFDIEPLPLYNCGPETFHEWNFQTMENPERRLPKCVAIQLPDEMKVTYTAHYRNLFCANEDLEEHAREQIDLRVNAMLSNIMCLRTQTCNVNNVNVIDCNGKGRTRRSAKTAGFSLQITSNPNKDNKNETLTDLENAFQNIQGAADKGEFTVDVLDDEYELDGNLTDISGKVVCGPGYTRVKFYCVPCGTGAYLYTDYCKSCPVGTYQDREGQAECINCPKGKSTVGIRSTSSDDCTVDELVTLEEGLKVTGIIVGCVSAGVVIVMVFFVYRRYKSKQGKLIEPTDINMSSSSTSALRREEDKFGPSNKKFEPNALNEKNVQTLSSLEREENFETSERRMPSRASRSSTFITEDGEVVHSKPWR